jgi:hypothetical protein
VFAGVYRPKRGAHENDDFIPAECKKAIQAPIHNNVLVFETTSSLSRMHQVFIKWELQEGSHAEFP